MISLDLPDVDGHWEFVPLTAPQVTKILFQTECSSMLYIYYYSHFFLPDFQRKCQVVNAPSNKNGLLQGDVAVDWWRTSATTPSKSGIQRSQASSELRLHALFPPSW